MTKKILIISFSSLFILSCISIPTPAEAQRKIEIKTTYPSPRGKYKELESDQHTVNQDLTVNDDLTVQDELTVNDKATISNELISPRVHTQWIEIEPIDVGDKDSFCASLPAGSVTLFADSEGDVLNCFAGQSSVTKMASWTRVAGKLLYNTFNRDNPKIGPDAPDMIGFNTNSPGTTFDVYGSVHFHNIEPLHPPPVPVTGENFIFDSMRGGAIAAGTVTLPMLWSTRGSYSVVFGADNQASGTGSMALGGAGNSASGTNSIAAGSNSAASKPNSVALGSSNNSSGTATFSVGSSNAATGDYAVAIGESNTAGGNNSVAIGDSNTSSALNAIALGDNNSSDGQSSVAIGTGNNTGFDGSMAFGHNNTVDADNAIAIGEGVTIDADDGIFIGISPADKVMPSTSTGDIVLNSSGNVGINKNDPSTDLDVNGSIALSFNGEDRAVRSDQDRMVIQGIVNGGGAAVSGSGFTVMRTGVGNYRITYPNRPSGNPTFNRIPSTLITVDGTSGRFVAAQITFASMNQTRIVIVDSTMTPVDSGFHFVSVGQ